MKKTLLFVLMLVILPLSSANALTIHYEATNLGGNHWQFDYYASGHTVTAGHGFQVDYTYGLYKNITAVSDPSGWTAGIKEPEVVSFPEHGFYLERDGYYRLTADVDASMPVMFSVQFDWWGQDDPNGQFVRILNADGNTVGTGSTTPLPIVVEPGPAPSPVPEPATLLLLGAGLIGMVAVSRKKRFKK